MGVYDTVLAGCPKCGKLSDFQTKGGSMLLQTFRLEKCPRDVLSDVNRHAPNICEHCGTSFKVDVEKRKTVEEGMGENRPRGYVSVGTVLWTCGNCNHSKPTESGAYLCTKVMPRIKVLPEDFCDEWESK